MAEQTKAEKFAGVVSAVINTYLPFLSTAENVLQSLIQKFGTKFLLTVAGVGIIGGTDYLLIQRNLIIVTEWSGVVILGLSFLVIGWIITEYFKARNEQEARAVTPTPQA